MEVPVMDKRIRRRIEGPRKKPVSVYLAAEDFDRLEAEAKADGLANGVVARSALLRGLPAELESRRKRRKRREELTKQARKEFAE